MNEQLDDRIWVWGLPLVILILMAVVLFSGINVSLFKLINGLSSITGERIWAFVTLFGDGLVCVVVLFPWIRKNPKNVLAVVLAVLVSAVLTQILKRAVDMSRPPRIFPLDEFNLIGPFLGKYSFPSGHSAMVFILAGSFSLTTNVRWRRYLAILLASLVAVSRIVVGVHWPLDILAGAFIGWLVVWMSLKIADRMVWGWKGLGQKILGVLLLLCCLFLLIANYTGYETVLFEQRTIAILFLLLGSYEYLRIYGLDILRMIGLRKP